MRTGERGHHFRAGVFRDCSLQGLFRVSFRGGAHFEECGQEWGIKGGEEECFTQVDSMNKETET